MPELQELLAVPPESFVKDADIESPDEAQLEQDFASMAFMFLRDRAQALMPYLLGFEVVDREEDGSRAVGIFGFKIGDKYFYVPAFFVNKQVKGMDLLYSKDTNSFVPLRETWVNHILNKSTLRLGEGAPDERKVREDFESPNFDFVAEPPGGTKAGASSNDDFDVWGTLQGNVVEGLHKDAEFQQAWAGAIATLKHETLDIEKTADGSPLIEYLTQFGGPRAVDALMHSMQLPKYANAYLHFYPDIKSAFVSSFSPDLEFAEAHVQKDAAKVTVTSEASPDMSDKERKRLVRDGFTVVDRRDDSEKSEMYDTEYERRYSNPTESGTYDLLLPTGSVVRAWVMQAAGGSRDKFLLCVEPKNKFYFTAESTRVFVSGCATGDTGPYDGGIDMGDMEVGRRYALVNEKGHASAPFRVEAVTSESGERVRIRVYFDTGVDHTSGYERGTWDSFPDMPHVNYDDTKYIQLADHEGQALKRTGESMIVPSNWKAIALTTKWEHEDEMRDKSDDDSDAAPSEARNAYDAFTPGNLTDLGEALQKNGILNLTVESPDESQYFMHLNDFTEGPLNSRAAMTSLVTKYGMGVDDAETVMLKASQNFKSRHLIKIGQLVGVNQPMPQMPTPGVDDYSGLGLALDTPYSATVPGDTGGGRGWQDSTAPGLAVGGQSETEQLGSDATMLAEQAAMSGQKNVFDHASIGGLARLYDSSSAIDMYLPELTKALDRLGRILFIFYWKNADFADRYGAEDLAEMEDLLRGVFKSFGDLVLKLKQKSVMAEDSKDVLTI